MKKILIIQGHPNKKSFVNALAEQYKKGAKEAGNEVDFVHLTDLTFDPVLWGGYKGKQVLEPDLLKMQEKIKWADHLVFTYPNWWGTMPALTKGFIDRTFLPGFAFKHTTDKFPVKLLKGRTASVLVTMDSPNFWYTLFMGAPGHKAIKRTILQFCGLKPVKISTFYSLREASDEKKKKYLNKAASLGQKA